MSRILYISLFHPDIVPGGAQAVAYELFLEACQQGVDATFLASVDPSKAHFYKPGAVITGFDRRPNEYLFLSRDYDYWWHRLRSSIVVKELFDFVRELLPDVVHVHHFLTFGIDIFDLIRKACPRARIIFTCHEFLTVCAADGQMVRRDSKRLCHGPSDSLCTNCFKDRSPEDFFMRQLWFKRNLSNCDAMIVPSRFMIDHFVDAGFDRQNFHVVENPLNCELLPKSSIATLASRRQIRFGFFGQMVDNKGFLLLLEAIELLRADGSEFFVEFHGGNINFASENARGLFLSALDAERTRASTARRFDWLGEYGSQDITRLMSRVDVVVVPSTWWEIYGLVLSEAWANGKPVIGSDVGGPGERIRDGVNGVHFKVGDARSLADVMRQFASGERVLTRFDTHAYLPPSRAQCFAEHAQVYGITVKPSARVAVA